VGEITIPDSVNGPLSDMPRAATKQGMFGIMEGHLGEAGPNLLDSLGGLLVSGRRLIGT